jgi:hypothetical protein
MGSMSWSDDTRCLYCEGRLPLYRKISHGQFCSSAHRKSYWQEQERLAVERLHQTHDSLRSYRNLGKAEGPEELAAHPTLESISALTGAVGVSNPVSVPILVREEAPLTIPDMLGHLAPEVGARNGNTPELIAADPFEYEFASQPQSPAHAWSAPPTGSFPEGRPVAAWTCVTPRSWTQSVPESAAVPEKIEYELGPCHPQSRALALEMRSANRVELPLGAGRDARHVNAPESTLEALEIAMAPVTHVTFEVQPQSDVLLELLDQQIPQPDRLHALRPFAAHQATFDLACLESTVPVDAPAQAILPAAALSLLAADYRLSGAGLHQLSVDVSPVPATAVSPAVIAEIPVTPPAAVISAAVMPEPRASVYQVGTAGLCTLPSTLVHPVQGVFAHHAADLTPLDLSTGVSSDVTFPSFVSGAGAAWVPQSSGLRPLTFAAKLKQANGAPRPEPIARLIPQAVEMQPVLPQSKLEPMDRKPPEDALRTQGSGIGALMRGEGLNKLVPAWAHASGFWQHAPRDLKLLLFAIPALLALVFHPGLPRVAFAAPQSSGGISSGFKRVLGDQLVSVRQTLENRAAIALDEDFRSGLDNWVSPGGSTTEWSFDSTGFVKPGPLALYRPSVGLADYQVQFMGLIDKKAMSWVVRAADFDNFYVVKLVVTKSGPLPAIGVTRYAVIGGKAQDRHDVNIPLGAREDTLYRVRMDVQGSNFSLEVQGQIADSWTETRLPRGGVGFFTARGEESRVRWVQITHQYDMLGRLCAYLAPYDTTNGSWQP